MRKAIFSQNFEFLANKLFQEIQEKFSKDFFQEPVILVPDMALKQRLLLHFVSLVKKRSIVGWKILTLDSYLKSHCTELFSPFEMQCLIFDCLRKSSSDEIAPFKNQIEELSKELTPLFMSYGKTSLQQGQPRWQIDMYNEILEKGLFTTPFKLIEKRKGLFEGVYFFGFDVFPPFLRKALSSLQEVSLYLFSPCRQFWSDISSQKEKKKVRRALLQQEGIESTLKEMELFWLEAPPLLSSLGKVGKDFLRFLEDSFFETEEVYEEVLPLSALKKLKGSILDFQNKEIKKDSTLIVYQTGNSILSEIECLKKEVLSFHEKGISFSEMLVFAPEIEKYLPHVEYSFSSEIPFRFTNVKKERIDFFENIRRLITLAKRTWTKERVSLLFESRSFMNQLHLEKGEKDKWIRWIQRIFDFNLSWQIGFKRLFKESLFHFKSPSYESISINDLELLEALYNTLSSLDADLSSLGGEKLTLSGWAEKLEHLLEKYFFVGEEEALDVKKAVKQLYISGEKLTETYPLGVVETLFTPVKTGGLKLNNLHAVTFSPLRLGSIWPSKAIFILGLDEESFPSKEVSSSLDLLKKERGFHPSSSDLDKYALLQAFFSAKEALILSYSHLSLEGKEKALSPAVEELVQHGERKSFSIKSRAHEEKVFSFTLSKGNQLKKNQKIFISDLILFAKNPWRYYTQKVLKVFLKEKEKTSILKKRGLLLRQSLSSPILEVLSKQKSRFPHAIQSAFESDVLFQDRERKAKLKSALGKLISLQLMSSCTAQVEGTYSPLKLSFEEGDVELIGEIPFSFEKGAVHFGEDHLSSLIKAWPEVLISLVLTGSDEIFFVKKEKVKKVSSPNLALKKFVSYYLRCKESLSPLMPEWADKILRSEVRKFDFKTEYDDPYVEWVLRRIKIGEDISSWSWLKESFSELIELYPRRKKG